MINPPPIIGNSKLIVEIRNLIESISDTYLNILITGETGVGKGIIAKNLHAASPRKYKPFITVNCAALPETLLESELYGYSKGAFTGAQKTRLGKFKMADKGVLFLDEIGDMPLSLQSKILHVLQTGTFSPLGADEEMSSDVWVIAATNHNLESKIKNKEFRADLFYRLNIIRIDVPPLRDRTEDIPLLIDYYISFYQKRYQGREIIHPNNEILDELIRFPWPGNIRQLQNIIKKQLIVNDWEIVIQELREGGGINQSNSPIYPGQSSSNNYNRRTTDIKTDSNNYNRRAADIKIDRKLDTSEMRRRRKGDIPENSILAEFIGSEDDLEKSDNDFSLKNIKRQAIYKVEKEVIGYVLNKTSWNRSKAAKILKISYKNLLTKISELNLEPPCKMS